MIFRVADNQVSDKNGQKIEMGVILGNMAGIDNLSVEIESIGAVVEKRCDPQFWTLIKGTLKDIAAYSGSALEWEITKRNIKSAYGVKFTVAEHMTQSQAEHYWDCIQEYVTENDIPVKTADNIIKDIEHYIATCRKNNTCCICGEKAHINIVYPLCVKHEVEYLELGKKAFDAHHHLPGAI
jgi:hypothetical protein